MTSPVPPNQQVGSPAAGATNAGWYPDPWRIEPFRWWDGHMWTAHVGGQAQAKPKVPAWSSWPVIICGIPMVIISVVLAFTEPLAVALGFVPLFIVGPVMIWLDRVEPEPIESKIHALLWGAVVATLVSLIVNTGVALAFNSEAVGAVGSAPIIEEIMKALGIVWMVKRKELDGVMDGFVYAGWVALGFAIVEDFLYFATAAEADQLAAVFFVRAILTPFAHPLFTAWTGLAVGRAVSKNKPIFPSILWGLGLAIAAHMAWNGSLVIGGGMGNAGVIILAILLFVILFIATAVVLVRFRAREQERFTSLVPFLAQHYGLSPGEVQIFSEWRTMLRTRKSLPKNQRKHFDGVHAALARLAVLYGREGDLDLVTEQRLRGQLQEARSAPLV